MQIYVCVKHVPDSAANIHILGRDRVDERVAFLLNPYDEHAVTGAVVLKDLFPGSQVVAVTVGKPDAEKTLRSAMAMGADKGVLVMVEETLDSQMTARSLACAIQRDGQADLVFTGKESIDACGMQTQFRLGALMNMPVMTNVSDIEICNGMARVTCDIPGGSQVFEALLPCVIGAGRGLNTPSYPTFPDIVKARKKTVEVVAISELDIQPPKGCAQVVEYQPLTRSRTPEKICGSPAEVAARIIRILKQEARVIS